MKIYLLSLFMLLFSGSLLANSNPGDVIFLNSGHSFTGKIKKFSFCETEFQVNRAIYVIPNSEIQNIQFLKRKGEKYKTYLNYLELSPSNVNVENCILGTRDADQFHNKRAKHVIFGILFGPFATIGAAIGSPSPYKDDALTLSENQALFDNYDYIKCYKSKAKSKNVMDTLIGWGIWILAVIIL